MLAIADELSASVGASGRIRAETRTPTAGLPAEVVSTPLIEPVCAAWNKINNSAAGIMVVGDYIQKSVSSA
jgi:hypothetical protein